MGDFYALGLGLIGSLLVFVGLGWVVGRGISLLRLAWVGVVCVVGGILMGSSVTFWKNKMSLWLSDGDFCCIF